MLRADAHSLVSRQGCSAPSESTASGTRKGGGASGGRRTPSSIGTPGSLEGRWAYNRAVFEVKKEIPVHLRIAACGRCFHSPSAGVCRSAANARGYVVETGLRSNQLQVQPGARRVASSCARADGIRRG